MNMSANFSFGVGLKKKKKIGPSYLSAHEHPKRDGASSEMNDKH